MPLNCWAAGLGDCDGQQSGEHVVSRGLWAGPTVEVEGFPWCKENKRIGISSLTANILCRRHNSALSPLDTAAIEAFKGFTTAARLANGRGKIPIQRWMPIVIRADGLLLERWCLKTALNLAYNQKPPATWAIGPDPQGELPPLRLVEAAFGRAPIARPLGLYALVAVEAKLQLIDELQVATMLNASDRIAGIYFRFHGLPLFFYASEEPLTQQLGILGEDRLGMSGRQLLYHLEHINCNVGNQPSHRIDLDWHP